MDLIDDMVSQKSILGANQMDKKNGLKVLENSSKNIIIFRDGKNNPKVEVLFHNQMLWLNQKQIAELFGVQKAAISKHLKNIFEENELVEEATVSILETVQKEGNREVSRKVEFYNLKAIIAVGYRVNSERAVVFRNWATNILEEFIQKGAVLDDVRLMNPEYIYGQDYFDEIVERIQDIRSSERRVYQKITDIYALCSADYSVESETTKAFFASVQNKLHFAIHGNTAVEVIVNRANHKEQNMGLLLLEKCTCW